MSIRSLLFGALMGTAVSTLGTGAARAAAPTAAGTVQARLVSNSDSGAAAPASVATPDLFNGSFAYSIPISVPPGRSGMMPQLQITYRSNGGNGWLGMGWQLEIGAIERSARGGVDFQGDAFVLADGDGNAELTSLPGGAGEYRAVIESSFTRVRRGVAPDGFPYFEATDRSGVRYWYGQQAASRQADPDSPGRIFKWCLERVEDTHGNYLTVTYVRDAGAIYPSRIDYAGNVDPVTRAPRLAPDASILFFREARHDAPVSYATGFAVRAAYRLKTVQVLAGGARFRAYGLTYLQSASTGRSLLSLVRGYGTDASVNMYGEVTGSAYSSVKVSWPATPASGWANPTAGYDSWANGSLLFNRYSSPGFDNNNAYTTRYPDVNGDGRADVCVRTDRGLQCWLSTGAGFQYAAGYDSVATTQLIFSDASNQQGWGKFDEDNWSTLRYGDLNGDGKADACMRMDFGLQCWLSTGTGWTMPVGYDAYLSGSLVFHNVAGLDANNWKTLTLVDVSGDGKADACMRQDAGLQCWLSTGAGWAYAPELDSVATGQRIFADYSDQRGLGIFDEDNWATMSFADVNGDGRADACIRMDYGLQCWLSTAAGWVLTPGYDSATAPYRVFPNGANQYGWGVFDFDNWPTVSFPDVNGDGKADACARMDFGLQCWLSTGTGWTLRPGYDLAGIRVFSGGWDQMGFGAFDADNWGTITYPDVNADGKADACIRNDWGLQCFMSTGDSFAASSRFNTFSTGQQIFRNGSDQHGYGTFDGDNLDMIDMPDVNGDGRPDACVRHDYGVVCWLNQAPADLAQQLSDDRGGTVSILYAPSTAFSNTQLPFAVQTVRSLTTADGNGNVATTSFQYSGGYYHVADQEFRGFAWARVTYPAGPGGEQLSEETWFHQGNDTGATNDPSGHVGYLKGKPYRTRSSDRSNRTLSMSVTRYTPDADGVAPWFTPPQVVDGFLYDGDVTAVQTRVSYFYDAWGNVVREDRYGDLATTADDLRIQRTFQANTSAWILGLPASEETLAGIPGTTRLAATWFYYDGVPVAPPGASQAVRKSPCAEASTSSYPVRGDLTRVVRWNAGGTDVAERTGHDVFGNRVCVADGRGAISAVAYDATATYPVEVADALGLRTLTEFYGVNGIPADKGLFGMAKRKIDPNGAAVVTEYDPFGRQTLERRPDGSWRSWAYVSGAVGVQLIRSDDSLGGWSETFLDGLGRAFRERRPGAGGKVIASTVTYDPRGAVRMKSLPYFEGLETPRYLVSAYDDSRRVLQTTLQAASAVAVARACYLKSVTVRIDENGHRKRETRDAGGRLVKVEEYLGSFTSCTTETGTPYATTSYSYDLLGQLRFITDTKGNATELRYDSLGRRTFLRDPDTGDWSYGLDANGNITSIVSPRHRARGQSVLLAYDALNRLTYRDNPTGADVQYGYDAGPNGLGRRTSMIDGSGSESYAYDALGRRTSTTKVVDGVAYTVRVAFDGAGRPQSVTYPDELVSYGYDTAGNLLDVSGYLSLSGHNALGLPGRATYANGVTTTYGYNDTTDGRLRSLTTATASQTYVDLGYAYDLGGNVARIDDVLDSTGSQVLVHDELNRLVEARSSRFGVIGQSYDAIGNVTRRGNVTYAYGSRPHAVQSSSVGQVFQYDENGNMTSDGRRIIAYDETDRAVAFDNGVVSLRFVNDGNGARVKWGSTVYVDRYLECTAAACGKYIFAGKMRVALRTGADVKYYHGNHQGSTVAVTDATGRLLEQIGYDAFGAALSEAGTVWMRHRYTSQELDYSGLYNYKSRSYDPLMGRFISPDTVVPDPANPQSLNRYAYCLNNPSLYVDETGHFWGLFEAATTIFSKATAKSLWDLGGTLFLNGGLDVTSKRARTSAWDAYGRSFRKTWRELDPFLTGSEMNNEVMLSAGYFLHIPGWESFQANLGYGLAHYANLVGYVDEVKLYKGSVVVNMHLPWGQSVRDNGLFNGASPAGLTLGPYINIASADATMADLESGGPFHDLLRHEYGHTIQSRVLGPAYFMVVGVPSFANASFDKNHSSFWVEVWASDWGGTHSADFPTRYSSHGLGYSLLSLWPLGL